MYKLQYNLFHNSLMSLGFCHYTVKMMFLVTKNDAIMHRLPFCCLIESDKMEWGPNGLIHWNAYFLLWINLEFSYSGVCVMWLSKYRKNTAFWMAGLLPNVAIFFL